jgi:hypothetical protein
MSQFSPDDENACYGVVVEQPGQDPILWEAEGHRTSHAACMDLIYKRKPSRWALVRLTYEAGNELLLLDMKRLHK